MKLLVAIMIILIGMFFYSYSSDREDKKVLLSKAIVEKNNTVEVEHNVIKKIVNISKVSKEENKTQEPLKFCLKSKQDIFSWQKNEFDSQGRLTAIISDRNRDGKAESKSFLTYDENGNLTDVKTETYQEAEKLYSDGGRAYSLGEMQNIPTEISEVHKEYDEQNRLINQITEKNGFSYGRTYEYNEKNDPVRITLFRNDNMSLDVAVLNDYDKQGRLISKKFEYLGSDGKTLVTGGEFTPKEYKYNEKGQLIEMRDPSFYRVFKYIYNELGEKIKEEIYLKTIKRGMYLSDWITYKYDKYGNLIEKRDKDGRLLLKQAFGVCEE